MMGWCGGGMGWGGWLAMSLFWLVFLGVIMFLGLRLLPGGGRGGSGAPGPGSPEDILDRRFAQGEIDVETYHAQRAALAQARRKK